MLKDKHIASMEERTEQKRPSRTSKTRQLELAAPQATASHSQLIAIQWQTERTDLQLDNFLLAIYFMRLGTLVDRAYDRHCQKAYGIGGGDMRVMLALRRNGPPYVRRPTDLFRALLVTSGAITKKVDRLVSAGYAERLPDPSHGGGFLVRLTKLGLQVVDEAVEHLADNSVLAPVMAQFTAQEKKSGADFVLKVLSSLEITIGDAGDPAEPEIRKPSTRRR
jgi:DNA-binding MarR family transcriptional regulator